MIDIYSYAGCMFAVKYGYFYRQMARFRTKLLKNIYPYELTNRWLGYQYNFEFHPRTFLTLTYDEEHLSIALSAGKYFRIFMNRMKAYYRKYQPFTKIHYVWRVERGGQYKRFHIHVLLDIELDIDRVEVLSDGKKIQCNNRIDGWWGCGKNLYYRSYGFHHIERIDKNNTTKLEVYISKYITKSTNNPKERLSSPYIDFLRHRCSEQTIEILKQKISGRVYSMSRSFVNRFQGEFSRFIYDLDEDGNRLQSGKWKIFRFRSVPIMRIFREANQVVYRFIKPVFLQNLKLEEVHKELVEVYPPYMRWVLKYGNFDGKIDYEEIKKGNRLPFDKEKAVENERLRWIAYRKNVNWKLAYDSDYWQLLYLKRKKEKFMFLSNLAREVRASNQVHYS